MKRLTTTITTLAAAVLTTSALAQSAQIPAPPQKQTIVLENATVHTTPGEVLAAPSYVVFDDGRITHVGSGQAPNFLVSEVIDATGLHIYPGLISTDTTLGLTEVGSVSVTQDSREIGDFTPEVRAAVAVNPDTDLIPVTRANGILTGLTFPQGGIIAGRCSSLRFDGWTWEDMTIDATAGLVINWPRSSARRSRFSRGPQTSSLEQMKRMRENMKKIDQFFDDAETYFKARKADRTLATDIRYEAMREAISGDKPLFIRADSADQIDAAVAWAVGRGLKVVIVGGSAADESIPVLTKHDVPVIISGTHRLPRRRHADYDTIYNLPARLHEAGVRFAIASGGEAAHERNLNHMAATAAAYGLPRDEALRAVTLSAAQIIGLGDSLGSIEVGKMATLIVTTGDPLEIVNDTLMAFIDGRAIDLGSRHKRLYAKYQQKYRQLGLIE